MLFFDACNCLQKPEGGILLPHTHQRVAPARGLFSLRLFGSQSPPLRTGCFLVIRRLGLIAPKPFPFTFVAPCATHCTAVALSASLYFLQRACTSSYSIDTRIPPAKLNLSCSWYWSIEMSCFLYWCSTHGPPSRNNAVPTFQLFLFSRQLLHINTCCLFVLGAVYGIDVFIDILVYFWVDALRCSRQSSSVSRSSELVLVLVLVLSLIHI